MITTEKKAQPTEQVYVSPQIGPHKVLKMGLNL